MKNTATLLRRLIDASMPHLKVFYRCISLFTYFITVQYSYAKCKYCFYFFKENYRRQCKCDEVFREDKIHKI